ncbi:PREDICTED: defensin-like protein [Ipomoea nil]|uniref:defensin-like protein n=1 Tax=Ipomoea nil TaxID=35883 RepID=UPI000901478D|nr:PREDICTED: defensin-like protein [Ipomoea nil]
MASSLRSFANALLYMIMLMATELGTNTIMVAAEARMCSRPSYKFKGPCIQEKNCASICLTEGFPKGDCKGIMRRCYCVKPC